MRNPTNYKEIIKQGIPEKSTHNTGIKNYTILNDLQYFNTFENYTADIMHDILEGVAPYEIKLFLTFIEQNKISNINNINARILNFNYGKLDIRDKPSPIVLDKSGTLIGQRAAQTYCLIRFLPLILGDLIKKNCSIDPNFCNKWKIIMLLLDIMDIIFSPKIQRKPILKLQNLIDEHHTFFMQQYDAPMIAKHHFMVHYPTIIERMGSLIHLWSMRFEAKHNYFKNLAKIILRER